MAGMVRISWWKVQAKRKSGRPVEWLPNRNEAGTDMPSTCNPGKCSSHDAPLLPALAILGAVTFLGLGTSWASIPRSPWSARRAPRQCAWVSARCCGSRCGAPDAGRRRDATREGGRVRGRPGRHAPPLLPVAADPDVRHVGGERVLRTAGGGVAVSRRPLDVAWMGLAAAGLCRGGRAWACPIRAARATDPCASLLAP